MFKLGIKHCRKTKRMKCYVMIHSYYKSAFGRHHSVSHTA